MLESKASADPKRSLTDFSDIRSKALRMGKSIGFLMAFLLGTVVSGIGLFSLWKYQHPNETEVWVVNESIRLENGAVIPVGTEFTIEHWMPEAFVTLTLHVNVEGEALEMFDKRVEPKRNLIIPIWVEQ